MMQRALSIKARLSVVFIFLFLLVIILGLESLTGLSYVNDTSAQIRDRWLPSTRALGDLNNYTTDFPAAEAAQSRAETALEQLAIKREMTELDRSIAAAEQAYRQIGRDPTDDSLFENFDRLWQRYRSTVASDRGSPRGLANEAASKTAYEAAAAALDSLTARNLARARDATQRSNLAYSQARRRISVTVFLAGLLVAGAMWHVTRAVSAPLVDLAARMHRLAASETSIEVLGISRRDEIGEMARAVLVFRNNAVDLAQNRQALAQQAAMLQQKLVEEQRSTLLQRNFVSMASHEFRTPLGIIDGHAQRLISMRDRLTAAELTERASKVREAVRRMTQMIANLIGSARLIDGRIGLHYHPAPVDLTALVREACHVQRESTPDANLHAQLAETPCHVHGDTALLNQVIGNLLSNAVKYSHRGALVSVRLVNEGATVAVVVEDQGIGIPESDRQRVFERYYRGSNTSGIVGSGVGLYLVRTIIDLHHGDILVESDEGSGTRFTLRLQALSIDTQPATRNPRQLSLVG